MTGSHAHGLPEDVVAFLHGSIPSIEQLEVLLLVWSTRPRAWTADQLVREIGTMPESIAKRLADLGARKLVGEQQTGQWTWIGDEDKAALVARVADTYRTRRVTVITCIMNRPNQMLRTFADAFRLRKEEDR